MRLNSDARRLIRASGLTIAGYTRYWFVGNVWGGDACGCPDDRCKDGFHHQPDEDCGCLPVTIAEARKAQEQARIAAAEDLRNQRVHE